MISFLIHVGFLLGDSFCSLLRGERRNKKHNINKKEFFSPHAVRDGFRKMGFGESIKRQKINTDMLQSDRKKARRW